jgi:hypothetical protein
LDVKNGLRTLSKNDYDKHPLWKYDEDTDLYYPVVGEDDFPFLVADFRIRASFHAQCGLTLSGYISGLKNIFAIGIFIEDQICFFNKNLPDLSMVQFEKLT